MIIKGSVDTIIFRSEESGYTVMEFLTEERHVTVVGCMPEIREGEMLSVSGKWVNNSKYGEQFQAEEITFEAPADEEGIINYLASGLFYGVGRATAEAIVRRFGLRTLDILENEPARLTEVNGIGKLRAESIAENFKDNSAMRAAILFLQKHSVPLALAMKIYKVYGESTESAITENPYRLVRDIDGVGFVTADKLADSLGYDKNSDFRISAGIIYALRDGGGRNGHTALPEDMLLRESAALLRNDDTERIAAQLPRLILEGQLFSVRVEREDGEAVPFYSLATEYNSEKSIAAKLVRLIRECPSAADCSDSASEIASYEKTHGIILDEKQKAAVSTAMASGVSVITGGPGTGKTTIIKCLMELADARGMECALCAPTGRAAKRLAETTGRNAQTIHRLIGMDISSGKPVYRMNESNPLSADIIVVDEISMADVYIFNALLKAVKPSAKVVLVGDKDQLPSVSPGNVLADIIASDLTPVTYLTEIYRQDADSLIVVNAHRINEGKMPTIRNSSKDFFYINKQAPESIVSDVVSLVTERLPKYFHITPADIQVLAPMKKGPTGVEVLNRELQASLNPTGKETVIGGVTFRDGDKVMHTVNNYDLEWRRGTEEGTGVFNGDVGTIKDIVRGELIVEFDDGRIVEYDRASQEDLMLAYAVSVHKSQGSEFPAVILALGGGSGMLFNRNLLYTAVTRAKNVVVIVGPESALRKAVANNYTVKRYTLLKELICATLSKASLLGF